MVYSAQSRFVEALSELNRNLTLTTFSKIMNPNKKELVLVNAHEDKRMNRKHFNQDRSFLTTTINDDGYLNRSIEGNYTFNFKFKTFEFYSQTVLSGIDNSQIMDKINFSSTLFII